MISIKKIKNKNNHKQAHLMKIRRFEKASSNLFAFFSMPHTLNTFDYIKKNLSQEYAQYNKQKALQEKEYESQWKKSFLELPQRIKRHKYNYVKKEIQNNPLSIQSDKGFNYYPEGFFYNPSDFEKPNDVLEKLKKVERTQNQDLNLNQDQDQEIVSVLEENQKEENTKTISEIDNEENTKSWMDLFILSKKFKHIYYNVTISSFLDELICETEWVKSEVFNEEKNKNTQSYSSFNFNDIEEISYQARENTYELDFSYHGGIGLHIRINNGKNNITQQEIEESLSHFLDNEEYFWLKQLTETQFYKQNKDKNYKHLQDYLNNVDKKSQAKINQFLKPVFKANYLNHLLNLNSLNDVINKKSKKIMNESDFSFLSFNHHPFNYQKQVFEYFVKQEFQYLLRKLENSDSEKMILEKSILTLEEYQVIFHDKGFRGLVAKSLQEEVQQRKLHQNGWNKIKNHPDLNRLSKQYDNVSKILFDKNNAFLTDFTQKIYYSSIISAEHEGDNFKRLNNYQTISFFKELFYSLEENKIKEIIKPLLNNGNLN